VHRLLLYGIIRPTQIAFASQVLDEILEVEPISEIIWFR